MANCNDVDTCKGLVVNRPQWFMDPEFIEWLNNGEPKFTWHVRGNVPGEYSDVIVLVDPECNGEGSEDGSMPQRFWDEIVTLCRQCLREGDSDAMSYCVRITNLD